MLGCDGCGDEFFIGHNPQSVDKRVAEKLAKCWIFCFSRVGRWFWVAVQLLHSFRPAAVGQREVGAAWGAANLGTVLEKEFRYV